MNSSPSLQVGIPPSFAAAWFALASGEHAASAWRSGRTQRGQWEWDYAGAEEPGMGAGAAGWWSGPTQQTAHHDVLKGLDWLYQEPTRRLQLQNEFQWPWTPRSARNGLRQASRSPRAFCQEQQYTSSSIKKNIPHLFATTCRSCVAHVGRAIWQSSRSTLPCGVLCLPKRRGRE